MPRTQLQLPDFAPDREVGSVYRTTGLVAKPVDARGGVAYVKGTGVSDNPLTDFAIEFEFEHTVDPTFTPPPGAPTSRPRTDAQGQDLRVPPLSELRDFYTALELPQTQQVVFLCYGSTARGGQATVYYVDILDQRKIKRLPTPHNATSDLPRVRAFPFVYRDEQYMIFSNGRLIRIDNEALRGAITEQQFRAAVTEVETDILAGDTTSSGVVVRYVPELQNNPIIAVTVWQQRLFIALKRTVHWSDLGDLTTWNRREEVNEVETRTLAGSFTLDQEIIRDVVVSDRSLYLFTSTQIYRATVSDVEVQFQVVPVSQSVDYLTGAVQYQNGIYFVSRAGIKFLPSGAADPVIVSTPINEFIQPLLRANEAITTAIVEDTSSVAWLFPERRIVVLYNTKFQRWQIIENLPAFVLGFSFTGSFVIGALVGEAFVQLAGTIIGNLSPRSLAHTTVVTADPANPERGLVHFIGFYSREYALDFRPYKTQGRRAVLLQRVSLRDVSRNDYTVQHRVFSRFPDGSYGNARLAEAPRSPDRRNDCRFYRKVPEIDLHIVVRGEFDELTTLVLEHSGEMGV